jgi:F0F1-type ATP synthase membrane subunit c/vacuolar-type H+-ATPase subunit K
MERLGIPAVVSGLTIAIAVLGAGMQVSTAYLKLAQSIERNTHANEQMLILHQEWYRATLNPQRYRKTD